jgi:hypothetical protein
MIKYPNELNNWVIWAISPAKAEVGIPISITGGACTGFHHDALIQLAGAANFVKMCRTVVIERKRAI